MSAKDFLNPTQKEQLQKALRESDNSDLREGCLILLLMNDGKSPREITDFLGCSYRTLAYWRFQGVPDNLEIPKSEKSENLKDQQELRLVDNVKEEFIPISEIKILEASFTVVKAQPTEFAAKFYRNLFADYPQLQPLFAYTRIEAQEKKLIMALVLVINNLRNLAYLKAILKDLGEKHVRYGTIREHYPMVGAVLLKTLESFLGTDWTPEVKRAWADGYEAIANLMMQGH